MKLLVVETSSIACSVALQTDSQIIERHAEEARAHTRLLVPMVEEVLAEGALTTKDLDALVLGNGPGSFIGLRIAASLVQGIAFASALPVISVSSLLAVATEVFTDADVDEVIVTADAHMNEVYLGRFAREKDDQVVAIDDECLQSVARLSFLSDDGQRRLAAGAGWQRYPVLYDLNHALLAGRSDVLFPRARYLLPEARRCYARGKLMQPDEIAPAYLRKQVATPKANT